MTQLIAVLHHKKLKLDMEEKISHSNEKVQTDTFTTLKDSTIL